jgi:hypothetical protein
MFYRGPDTIWLDRMVLFIMKLFSDGGGLTLLLVRSFYYFEVLVGVKLRFDDQPYTGGCQRNEVHDNVMADMRFYPPSSG